MRASRSPIAVAPCAGAFLAVLVVTAPPPPWGKAVAGAAESRAWSHPPFTLFPAPPAPGDTLRCVIPARVHRAPDRGSPGLTTLEPGDPVLVRGLDRRDGVPWVESDEGWIEAARLDRPASSTAGEFPAGAEGLASGTVLDDDWEPPGLARVPDSLKAPGFVWREMRLVEPALEAFRRLVEAAEADGVRIGIVSAYRDAEYQRRLYERAVARDPRQRESASPGRSEHRLGTTADVATPGVPPFREELERSPAGRWLISRAVEFGIVATYSRERHPARGVAHEPWHLRWVGDHTDDARLW